MNMFRRRDALRLTHNRTGLSVTVEYARSWLKTLERARRILRARVHAHDKGLKAVLAADPECTIEEPVEGQVVAVATISQYKYRITLKD